MAPTSPEPKTNGDAEHEEQETKKPSSPLLTEQRLSTASLDNVNLEDSVELNGNLEKSELISIGRSDGGTNNG